ncbi:hypothetical protein AOQ84DRAFT_347098 [Glonium stellatum]|uniref:BZIP domain-containing protein n=1 Tax=Glonium stellatum TaxID=574774 RepID=A0A8E2JP11_9PEZI|nr:hypothetical protein AOQ84DRAFT_347098 [Glonium stellatum]
MGADSLPSTFTALITSDMISQQPDSSPAYSVPSTTIKMEDLQTFYQSSPSPSPETPTPTLNDSKPESKPAKKRKSWGQVLPEPKTNLPPRKRAKTEDEKEQRRIERVKRNRLAAHNSRERKRQEVEQLQSEKEALERSMKAMREQMNRMAAELKAFRERHPNSLPESSITTSIEDYDILLQSDTICPRQASFPSPESMDSMDTPRESSSQPSTPAYSETAAIETDQTQHPAAMLCDLQYLYDENPVDNFFDLSEFPDAPESSLVDASQDFFNSSFMAQDPIINPYGLCDQIGAKHFDLQADSGATNFVSDETSLAAEV